MAHHSWLGCERLHLDVTRSPVSGSVTFTCFLKRLAIYSPLSIPNPDVSGSPRPPTLSVRRFATASIVQYEPAEGSAPLSPMSAMCGVTCRTSSRQRGRVLTGSLAFALRFPKLASRRKRAVVGGWSRRATRQRMERSRAPSVSWNGSLRIETSQFRLGSQRTNSGQLPERSRFLGTTSTRLKTTSPASISTLNQGRSTSNIEADARLPDVVPTRPPWPPPPDPAPSRLVESTPCTAVPGRDERRRVCGPVGCSTDGPCLGWHALCNLWRADHRRRE